MIHLTPARVAALMEGTLDPREASLLAEHLASGCPECAQVLESGPDLDVIARLLEAEEAPLLPLSREERDHLWRGVSTQRSSRWWRGPAVVGALLLAAALLLFLLPGRHPDELTLKGGDEAPEITLRIVAGHMGPKGMDLERRVAPEEVLTGDLTLLFELEVDREAHRTLIAVDGDEVYTLHSGTSGPGRVRLETGFALDDVEGELVFLGAASEEPLDVADLVEPWRAGTPWSLSGVGLTVQTVEVAR